MGVSHHARSGGEDTLDASDAPLTSVHAAAGASGAFFRSSIDSRPSSTAVLIHRLAAVLKLWRQVRLQNLCGEPPDRRSAKPRLHQRQIAGPVIPSRPIRRE